MRALEEMRTGIRLDVLLGTVGMSRSTYYYRLGMLRRLEEDPVLKAICKVFEDSERMYGHRKVTSELASKHGIRKDRKTVYRIMKENGLHCLYRPKKHRRAPKDQTPPVPNVLKRDFSSDTPSSKFVTDVTEFQVRGGKLYLSAIMDLCGRPVPAYSLSSDNNADMVMEMMHRLEAACPRLRGAVIHSDQGCLYKSVRYRRFAESRGIIRSMSRKGNCYDNAVIESFFGQMKSEIGPMSSFRSIEDLRRRIEQYIEYYNNRRIQLGLGGLTPTEYRAKICNVL